jgi:dUTP pyrophosphatase
MLKIKFRKLKENVNMPVKGSEHAACFDVYANSLSYSGQKIIVGLGFQTEIPKGYRGVIVPRSNITKHYWVMNNSIGIIDSDYRGEWMCIFTPIGNYSQFPYSVGDRVAQIYFEKVEDVEFVDANELESSERGTGGFGSTGLI